MSWLVKVQADDFYNAYLVLHKSGVVMSCPVVVNLAFATELYIKDLHFVLTGKTLRGHNILELFRDCQRKPSKKLGAILPYKKSLLFTLWKYSRSIFLKIKIGSLLLTY